MGKFEIKSIGIMITIMILLNFAQPVLSTSFFCRLKCTTQCAALRITSKGLFNRCVNDCKSHCSKLSDHPFYNCISDCHLTKSNAINDGAPHNVNNEMNTCIQKCKKIL
ncbi:uncharacterized protein HKW66_Vig0221430 [Vigna angularis]|uniref:Knottin scorpion toxin-like domain-containing protein n=1 Tax=Phaseolus angularis TaxID=3914 RepID=A0A8T0K025_PHAAN|nr:uncharacterized protein HKW66_Vig0221430 [Vigna angularis]